MKAKKKRTLPKAVRQKLPKRVQKMMRTHKAVSSVYRNRRKLGTALHGILHVVSRKL